MSTSPEPSPRADDQIVTALSRWLARHVGNDELERRMTEIGTDDLGPVGGEMVGELAAALAASPRPSRGDLEMIAREALEAVAHGE